MKGKSSAIIEKIIPIVSHVLLAIANLYCLLIYYDVTGRNLMDLGYVPYLTMMAYGLIGLTKFFNEDLFIDLRILLDYALVVLPHPFLTTALWQKHSVGPNETALMHSFFGLAAFLFFVLMEYKRQDLTDLALITSVSSSAIVGVLYENYIASGAAVVVAGAYFALKRNEECALQSPQAKVGYFNIAMTAYSVLSLAQFEPKNWIPEF